MWGRCDLGALWGCGVVVLESGFCICGFFALDSESALVSVFIRDFALLRVVVILGNLHRIYACERGEKLQKVRKRHINARAINYLHTTYKPGYRKTHRDPMIAV